MINKKEFISLLKVKEKGNILTPEEEKAVFEYYFHNPCQENRNLIAVKNQGLVHLIANRYKEFADEEDLFQEGMIGLMRAIDEFDYTKGNKFSTYAHWWIRQSVSRYIMNNSRVIRIPVHLQETFYKISQYITSYLSENMSPPDIDQMASDLGVSVQKIDLFFLSRDHIVSLDTPVKGDSSSHDSDTTLSDFVQDENANTEKNVIDKIYMEGILSELESCLNEREYDILSRRFGLCGYDSHTLEEVGQFYELSRERIRQIEQKALRKAKFRLRLKKYRAEDLLS